jgi:hypothetical protein
MADQDLGPFSDPNVRKQIAETFKEVEKDANAKGVSSALIESYLFPTIYQGE